MSDSVVTTVFLPIALAIIMLGLGLSLTVADFTRVLRYPKAVAIALTCQVVVLPLICLGLVELFGLPPVLAVGMMLLAASPGGTTANLFSHLAGGDVALNVTLTAINSVLSVLTLPLVVNLSLNHFMGAGEIGLQPAKMLQVFAIVLIPVGLGMLINRRWPAVSDRLRRPVKIGSVAVLVAVIVTALVENRDIFFDSLADVGLVSLLLSILSLAIGYFVPRLSGIDDRQSIACSMEIGIHNATLAITIALSPTLLNSSEMAIAPAVYGILMFFPAAVVGYALGRRVTPAPDTIPAQPPPP